MGKVIKKQIQGMSWLSKTGLVLLLTLATSVFMYQGWYKPVTASAATVVYGVTVPSTASTGIDGAAQMPTGGASIATAPTVRGNMSTTVTTSGASYRPTTGMTSGTPVTLLKLYSPAYATAQTITAPAGSFAIRGYNASDTWTFHLYSHNPAGTAGNKTLMYSSNTTTSGTGSTVTVTPTYTLVNSSIAAGYKLLVEVVYTPGGTTYTPRVYLDGTAAGSWCQLTVTETAAVTDSTPPTAGTVTITPDVSSTYTSSAPTVTTIFTDAQSAVSSCQYTTDGSTWLAGSVTGAGPNYTCTANPTGLTGFLNINMRATSGGGGPAAATQIQRTVDATVPTDGALTVTKGNTLDSLSWTAATDTGGSGIASYVLRFATGATAPANCTSGTAVPGSPFSSAILSTTHTGLTNGTQYSYRLCATDNLGNATGGVTGSATPAVGPVSTITTCSGCHGDTTTFNDGTARNVPAGQFPGSHNNHVITAGTACSVCHTVPATTTSADFNHANGTITMASPISGGSYAKGTSWAVTNTPTAFTSCNTTTCHGTSSPTWGANTTNASCTKCHGVSGTTPAQYTADNKTAAPGYNGGRSTSGATAATDVKVGAHAGHLAGSSNYSNPIACTECHANINPANASFTGHMNGTGNVDFGTLAKTNSAASAYTGPNCTNTYCHFGKSIGLYAPATANASVAWTNTAYLNGTSADCQKCHLSPPSNTGVHAGKVFPADCNACHSHVSVAGLITDKTKHINGVVDGSGVSSGGSPCYGCHSAYNVMNGSAAVFHHVLDDASPDQAPNTGAYPSSQSVLACTSCHTDHNYFNSSKSSNLRTAYNAAAGTKDNHDFSTTAPYGLCVSCHSTAQTKSTAQTVAGTTTTITIDGSATGFQASMHNYTASSLFGTAQFSANCVKCHSDEQTKDKQTSPAPDKYGTHYSAQRSLLNTMGATPQAAAGADFCYRCHSKSTDANPGGGAAKITPLKDYFGSKAMTAAAEDTFSTMQLVNRHNVSSYKGLHKDTETRADIAAAKHVECVDCHDPHLAKSGRHTAGSAALAGVLTGVAGVGVTTWGTNWAGVTATAYNPSTTTAALITATAEWQVCFKCHSGANANVATWGGAAATAAAFTDLALEFNPNNASGHPVVAALPAANQLTAARLTGGWVPGSVMTCSDCHATDSAASKGPHGSSVKWMLAGVNKAWPYTTAAGNGGSTGTLYRIATYNTGAGTNDGLFCLNCHTIRPATGVNNWHSNTNVTGGQHGSNAIMACASCHIRIPHGGKISRLLQTTNAPARYRSNGSTATSSWDFWGGAGGIKNSAFSNASFNSSCGQHNSGTGEAW